MKNWLLIPVTLISFNIAQAADMPPQGMSMAKVEKQFGTPSKKLSAVGKPPITRWVYPSYTVVFEYKHVVQSVKMVQDTPISVPSSPTPAPSTAPNEATISVEVQTK
ncbi:hypothetical protein [Agitococcus lubricus]|uniref:SmpA/OmlA family protein n=1 Tax=Agitococcus lubricus TaxID=1077255 RepID=A0A2T5J079_9GAMM|nr:hypothetical protein [Agitococcus lubricus]PTQ89744.1 hypothetical protein C8N29_10568 [Agitococcus lubricus]